MLVDVVLPLAFEGCLTYNIPDEIDRLAAVGMRVLVPLGKRKITTGIICAVPATAAAKEFEVKDIVCFLDEQPLLTDRQLQLWQWIASYYMCTLGEVMKAALPTALKLDSETRVQRNTEIDTEVALTPNQRKLLDNLADGKPKNIGEIGRKLNIGNVLPALNGLLELGVLTCNEQVTEKYRPLTRTLVTLAPDLWQEERLQTVLETLKRVPKQQALLLTCLQECMQSDAGQQVTCTPVGKKELLEKSKSSPAVLKGLLEKGILQTLVVPVERLHSDVAASAEAHVLNAWQQTAMEEILSAWQTKDVVLLHGVTASGKTELYIHLIQRALQQHQQVLYLVPEIALTTQLTDRLQAVFGNRLGVYHSRFSEAERVEIYRKVQRGEYDVLLGVRSSLFLPFARLGLVVVDEEHDASYKQQEPAPRYHARNAAMVLARLFGAKVLLGTATPAIETYYNALVGKYGLVRLTHRHQDVEMPEITLIDTRRQYHRKEMTGHFADGLVSTITDEIGKNKQVIVFQNRRGYAPYMECRQCAYIPKCIHCDVSLTVHKQQHVLVCHYCGYTIPIPSQCPACGQQTLADRGFGTEKIEDEIRELFPAARVARMDLDTTRNKNAYRRIIADFETHATDILVGTQMISKGLHFDNVSLVAVLNADNLMNQPTFRAYEYAFQMLEQVSGRAGRKGKRGTVYIQTANPDNPLFRQLVVHDYEAFYAGQIKERKMFKYPPFYRLLEVCIRHREAYGADAVAAALQQRLKTVFARRCSPVIVPVVGRMQNLYVRTILLKIEADASYAKAKLLLKQSIDWVCTLPEGKSARIHVDVDPV